MAAKYAVYVSDPNGWERDCPDSESVFFGGVSHGQYYRHAYLLPDSVSLGQVQSVGTRGFVVLGSHREAVALRNRLNASGDWTVADGWEARPVYAIAKLTAADAEVRP